MNRPIDVLLLLALPASGKSEVRRYLDELPDERRLADLHLGPLLQLHDYSYVHMMRRTSQVLRALGRDPVFFDSDVTPMKDPHDWGTLVELVNEDFDDQVHNRRVDSESAAAWLLDRYDAARTACGVRAAFGALPAAVREQLVLALEAEAQEMVAMRNGIASMSVDGRTVVIALARGGPESATPPLPAPLGYQYALSRLSDAILSRASILYVWATPEQARRNNAPRANESSECNQSLLHHGVPDAVMRNDYGCDDLLHLVATSGRPDTVKVDARGRSYFLPTGCFDNRVDRTGFVRGERSGWPAASERVLHEGLRETMARIVAAGDTVHVSRKAA